MKSRIYTVGETFIYINPKEGRELLLSYFHGIEGQLLETGQLENFSFVISKEGMNMHLFCQNMHLF